jgi:zinc protease
MAAFPGSTCPWPPTTNWYNAHNFYGDLAELDAATLEDAKKFFETYYAPNNAAVVVSGDIDTAQTLNWVKKYFGSIKASALPPRPDISEPRQEQEKRASTRSPPGRRSASRTTCRRAGPRNGSPSG